MSIQKRTKIFLGIAGFGVAALLGVAIATGTFPPHENASGAIGAVKKSIDQQIDQKDVVLGSAAGNAGAAAAQPAIQTQNELGSRQIDSKQMDSKRLDSKQMDSKQMDSKRLDSKQMDSKQMDSKIQ